MEIRCFLERNDTVVVAAAMDMLVLDVPLVLVVADVTEMLMEGQCLECQLKVP